MKSKMQDGGLDLFRPFVDLFHELILIIIDLSKKLTKLILGLIFKKRGELEKIERSALAVQKVSVNDDSLGIDTRSGKNLLLNSIDFRRHSFIVGASGFGKTNLISILQEYSLKEDKPIIFFDPKGDLEALTTFKELCSEYNRACYIFSEHYEDSISLNPILEGSVNQIVDRIMRSFEWSEPYYRDASRRSLTKALNQLNDKCETISLKTVFDELVQMETKDNIGLIAKIEAILVSDFGKILNSNWDGLTLSKIRDERACLYIGLSTQGYGETAMSVGKLFLGELLYNSYKSLITYNYLGSGIKNPISVYFDEFGSLVTPEFIELQNKCRGAGIELTMAVQTASDIDRVNPDLTKQIIENAANLFVLKQRLPESASFFAEAIGTVISKKQTFKLEDGEESLEGSQREVHELLVHPDIIKNLKIGQCVLLRQGPSQLNLINIRNRETSKKVNKNIKNEIIFKDVL